MRTVFERPMLVEPLSNEGIEVGGMVARYSADGYLPCYIPTTTTRDAISVDESPEDIIVILGGAAECVDGIEIDGQMWIDNNLTRWRHVEIVEGALDVEAVSEDLSSRTLTLPLETLMEVLERVRIATAVDLVDDGLLGQEEGIAWIDGHQVAVKQDPEKENLALFVSVEPTSEEGT